MSIVVVDRVKVVDAQSVEEVKSSGSYMCDISNSVASSQFQQWIHAVIRCQLSYLQKRYKLVNR